MTFRFRRTCCIVISILFFLYSVFIPASYAAKSNAQGISRNSAAAGLNLDIARRYYPVSTIKSMIRMVSREGGSYIQLHVSDNENYGIESHILNQTTSRASCNNGIYSNPASGKKFLSSRQIKSLTSYASKYHISLIPEIDLPGHALALHHLIRRLPKAQRPQLTWAENDELEMNSRAIRFTKQLDQEVWKMFQKPSVVSLGMDECGDSSASQRVQYYNQVTSCWNQQGVVPRVYSDFFKTAYMKKLNRSVQVIFWCRGDWDQSCSGRKSVSSAAALTRCGFTVINANGYYLYFIPKQSLFKIEKDIGETPLDYSVKDLRKNWRLSRTDMDTGDETSGIHSALLSVWGEDSKGLSDAQILSGTRRMFRAMVSSMKSGS
ncbi:MAG: family 20 glycosylhydrolase [Eubacterium sp.]